MAPAQAAPEKASFGAVESLGLVSAIITLILGAVQLARWLLHLPFWLFSHLPYMACVALDIERLEQVRREALALGAPVFLGLRNDTRRSKMQKLYKNCDVLLSELHATHLSLEADDGDLHRNRMLRFESLIWYPSSVMEVYTCIIKLHSAVLVASQEAKILERASAEDLYWNLLRKLTSLQTSVDCVLAGLSHHPQSPGNVDPAHEADDVTVSDPMSMLDETASTPPTNLGASVTQRASETESRTLIETFRHRCHANLPLIDTRYSYELTKERLPLAHGAMLVVAKIALGGNLSATTPVADIIASALVFNGVSEDAVQAMILIAAWSETGLMSTQALETARVLQLHTTIARLLQNDNRSDEAERTLMTSAKIWMHALVLDLRLSLGTGRTMLPCDRVSVVDCRKLLSHRTATMAEAWIIVQVELSELKSRFYDDLTGCAPNETISLAITAMSDLNIWWENINAHIESHVGKKKLAPPVPSISALSVEMEYARLWLASTALRGASWNNASVHQKKLVTLAAGAASAVLSCSLQPGCPVHSWTMAAFAAVFIMKVLKLFPDQREPEMLAKVKKLMELSPAVQLQSYFRAINRLNSAETMPAGPAAPDEPLPLSTFEGKGHPWLYPSNVSDLGLPTVHLSRICLSQ